METSRCTLKAPDGWKDVGGRVDVETQGWTFALSKDRERQVKVGPFYPSKEVNARDGWCVYVFTRETMLAGAAFRKFKTRAEAEAHTLDWMRGHPDG